MPVGLSYQCQKTVIRYLEANKRISLSSRCPSLRKIERLIPLQLDTLIFFGLAVLMNGKNQRLFKSDDASLNFIYFIPPGVDANTVEKQMVGDLVDRRKVYVKRMVVNSKPVYLGNTKFHIRNLTYNIKKNIDLGFVDQSSYPLRELTCYVNHDDDYSKITRNLTILNREHNQRIQRLLTTQYFSSVTLKHFVISGPQLGEVLEHWRAGILNIGTKSTMHYENSLTSYEQQLAWLKQNFGGRTAFMSLHCGTEVRVHTYEYDSKSVIAIYATKNSIGGSVIMEVVPLRMTYSLEDSVIFKGPENQLLVIFLAIMAMFVFFVLFS